MAMRWLPKENRSIIAALGTEKRGIERPATVRGTGGFELPIAPEFGPKSILLETNQTRRKPSESMPFSTAILTSSMANPL